jgi:putative SOS response-associated peptidase YedK
MLSMCGRYTLNLRNETFAATYGVQAPLEFGARFNIAPMQRAPVIRPNPEAILEAVTLRWGFPAVQGRPLINARAETVMDKPSFRAAYRTRRILVPNTGYYEWQTLADGKKQPHLLHIAQQPLAFAGLWTTDGDLECFTVITTAAGEGTRAIHDRQPVILDAETWQTWLAPDTSPRDLAALLHSDPRLEAYQVSNRVGSVKNDDATLLERTDLN